MFYFIIFYTCVEDICLEEKFLISSFLLWKAVIEKISLKQEIFSDLEKICPPHCILATNTSTIDLHLVGAKTHVQDRIIGAHFFR